MGAHSGRAGAVASQRLWRRPGLGQEAPAPYKPPPGWIEPVDSPELEADSRLGIFHITDQCPQIKRLELLRVADKPYTARPCGACAKYLRR